MLSLWNVVCSVSVKESAPLKRCPCQENGNDAAQTTVSTCCVVFRCTMTVWWKMESQPSAGRLYWNCMSVEPNVSIVSLGRK